MVSQFQPGDHHRAWRTNERDQSIPLSKYEGMTDAESIAAQIADMIPGERHYVIRRAGAPEADEFEVSEADYKASQEHYRRHRDADGTSPEAVENVARWAARGLTDPQFEQAWAVQYGPIAPNRAQFNAMRTRFRAARG